MLFRVEIWNVMPILKQMRYKWAIEEIYKNIVKGKKTQKIVKNHTFQVRWRISHSVTGRVGLINTLRHCN